MVKTTQTVECFLLTGILFVLPVFCLPNHALAGSSVVINEIAWMGTKASAQDEWIELYNNSDQEIILDDWVLQEGSGTNIIKLSGRLAARAYFLIERTDDSTIADINADVFGAWGGSGLANTGEKIILKDTALNSVDEVDCLSGWFAGVASPDYKTMERIDPNLSGSLASNWQTNSGSSVLGHDPKNNSVQGTPRGQNSAPSATSSPPPASVSPSPSTEPSAAAQPLATAQQNPGPQYEFSNDILISEFMPNPGTGKKEWIELYNSGENPINLIGWQIKDDSSIGNRQTIPEGSHINPRGYFLIELDSNFLNNDGDELNLLWPNDEKIHTVSYPIAEQNLSCARFDKGWEWTNQPTPDAPNKESVASAQTRNEAVPPKAKTKIEIVAAQTKSPLAASPNAQARATEIAAAPKPAPTNQIAETLPSLTPGGFQPIAAVSQDIKSASHDWLMLGLTTALAVGAGLGLIYFRRQKNLPVDTKKSDDKMI